MFLCLSLSCSKIFLLFFLECLFLLPIIPKIVLTAPIILQIMINIIKTHDSESRGQETAKGKQAK